MKTRNVFQNVCLIWLPYTYNQKSHVKYVNIVLKKKRTSRIFISLEELRQSLYIIKSTYVT